MLLSVIIPLYNGELTINRLLESIKNQKNFDLNNIEVVICNDNSTDNSVTIIKNHWMNQLNIKLINTEPREKHSPGNTRYDALPKATGDWITFIDCDDEFELEFFSTAFETIEKENIDTVVKGLVREWDYNTLSPKRVLPNIELEAVLHGKIYNRKWLEKHKINFFLDMDLLEDLYFNTKVQCALYIDHKNSITINKYFYKWGYYNNSFSHSNFGATNSSNYSLEYMKGYMLASIVSYFDAYKNNSVIEETKKYMKNQILFNILHTYFYIQSNLYYGLINPSDYNTLYNFFNNTINTIENELLISKSEIIIFGISDIDRYYRIKNACQGGNVQFIELKSFNDFILNK